MTDIEWENALRQQRYDKGFADGKAGTQSRSWAWLNCAEYMDGYRDGTTSREKKNG
jgi:hypothetical protein